MVELLRDYHSGRDRPAICIAFCCCIFRRVSRSLFVSSFTGKSGRFRYCRIEPWKSRTSIINSLPSLRIFLKILRQNAKNHE